MKAKVDTGLGRQSAARIKQVSPLAKGHGVLAVTEMASENKKELGKKMKIKVLVILLLRGGGGGGVCLFRSKKHFYFCDF